MTACPEACFNAVFIEGVDLAYEGIPAPPVL